MKLSFIIYNCSLLKIRVTSADIENLLTNTFIDGYMNKFYLIKVLRQTEEANVIVASSYNAVVKWSLMNSLYFYLRISYKSNYTCLPSRRFRGSTGIPLFLVR